MSEQELKKLFKKIVPAAYQSLKEAESLPEGEVKQYKVETASERILKAFKILEQCESVLNNKYFICFSMLAEGDSKEYVQNYLIEMGQGSRSFDSIFERGIKEMSCYLSKQEQVTATGNISASSIQERLKARKERMEG
ncbi:hypothetical protein [Rummeliibacillus sp. POC4]|uniref:hypothetical protein n=1 Tax=Rummeliibacillus sp. POC4 TaxID=2305899 RepID=UPI000E6666F1|nr:hypothetical protein [Rummeliibacillus sp. POC4]RIJ64153.1 hypothetical protein D1606_11610 [Rummeliibacillus sp. POC4]